MKKIMSLIALFAILNQSAIQAQIQARIQSQNFNYTVNVKATIEKIVCVNAYDGNSDNTEEIYGEIKVTPGYVCFDVDRGEDHQPINYSGIGKWELKPNQYHRMKKGDVLPINYTRSWTYYFPPKCDKDPSHQTVVRCQSNLDERDMPHDPDDKLNEPCGGACFNDVYLNQVKQQGEKTFQFQQRHESGGSKFVVHFRIETVTTLMDQFIFKKVSGLTPTPLYLMSNQDKSVSYIFFQDGRKSVEFNLFTGDKKEIALAKGKIYEDYVFEKQSMIKTMKAQKKNPVDRFCDWWESTPGPTSVDAHCKSAFCDWARCQVNNDCVDGKSLIFLEETFRVMCGGHATISDLSRSKPPLKKEYK